MMSCSRILATGLLIALTLHLISPARADLIGHGGIVRAVSVSADGARILTASFDYSVRLWDFGTQQSLKLLDAHEGPVNAVRFLPGDARALSGGKDGTVLMWDLQTGTVIRTFSGHTMHVMALTLHPNGKVFASASWDGSVRQWDLADGRELSRIDTFSAANTLTYGDDGNVLITGHKDGKMRMWSATTGAFVDELVGHNMAVTSNVLSAGGSRLLSTGIDGSIRLWSLSDRATILTLDAHDGPVFSASFSPDGRQALSGGRDGQVKLWDLSTGLLLKTITAHDGPVWSVTFSPDGRFAISSGSDESVRIFHLQTGDRIGPREEDQAIVEPKPWLISKHPGARLFRKCAICHSLLPNGKYRSGPHLVGLFGRPSGSVDNYNYSTAMRALGVIWSEETVRQLFSLGPDKFVPGTKMPIQKVNDPRDLDMLIDYLQEVTNGDGG